MSNTQQLSAAAKLINVDWLVLNLDTGEIYGHEDKPSAYAGQIDYQPKLSDCRSVDDLSALLKHVDRRNLPEHTLHRLIDALNYAHGVWRNGGADCHITIPMMNTLTKLHELVLFRNVIIMSQANLAKALSTSESNLTKKLKTLINSSAVRVSTFRSGSGDTRKGEIKLTINPRLIFRGGDYTRNGYIDEWYRPVGYLQSGALRPLSADEFPAIAA